MKSWTVVLAAGLVIALPFIFRKAPSEGAWKEGDPVLVIISPHNEAIRSEFAKGFSKWRQAQGKSPVKIDWRVVGGTSEISRYLNAEMQASFKAWWLRQGNAWPLGASDVVTSARFDPEGRDPELLVLRENLRAIDDAQEFGTGLDIFFGGGEYDHSQAGREGLTVAPWPQGIPERITHDANGNLILPEGLSGEKWIGETFMGTALSTFGIVANLDRLQDLGVTSVPVQWEDLADPAYFREIGVSDPTKSGSIAKAFEMLIHQQIFIAVAAAGFSPQDITFFEENVDEAPEAYHAAITEGWENGVNLVRLIGANARYFTDSASKVPIDVSMGNATVGLAIDFYGRYQAESSRSPEGVERMIYLTPMGGSSVSADPISLLRGAPHRALAVEFIEYTVSIEGQQLWNYGVGLPGGPEKYALRRLPIRRDFYPSDNPEIQAAYELHQPFYTDDLGLASVNPYYLAEQFEYIPRWTGKHFGIHRYLIRAMCLDSGEELTEAWQAIQAAGGPAAVPEAMDALMALPPELNWDSALGGEYRSANQMVFMREWVLFFRQQYRLAKELAEAPHA
ncbi:ABC transporter substrate-binding protein [Kiritimatiellota bacterium B12222]|nr:ABC transporter substrate-binding protein [Kiritimatiellota bacterium B12222]